MNVFRLNMSHGAHDGVAGIHKAIRHTEVALGRPIGILADLLGPKIRCGIFAEMSVRLNPGDPFRFDLCQDAGDEARVCLPHADVLSAAQSGVYNSGQRRQDPDVGN